MSDATEFCYCPDDETLTCNDCYNELRAQLQAERERAERAEEKRDYWKQDSAAGWDKCEEHRKEADSLREALKVAHDVLSRVAEWCHGGHGYHPQATCGLCMPVLSALAAARKALGSET